MTDEKREQPEIIEIDFTEEDLKSFASAFNSEAAEVVNQLDDLILRLEQNPIDEISINHLYRKIHTLKGSVGSVPGGQLLGSLAHEFEAVLSQAKAHQIVLDKDCIDLFLQSSALLRELTSALSHSREFQANELSSVIELISRYSKLNLRRRVATSESSPRPDVQPAEVKIEKEEDSIKLTKQQVEKMSQMASQVILIKNQVQQGLNSKNQDGSQFLGELTRLADEMQKYVQEIKKHPLEANLKSLSVLFRQTCLELNKDAEIHFSGQNILVDKGLGQDIYSCLVHLVRNSLDHGIEDSFDRTISGKNPKGQITIDVIESQHAFEVVFRDDGKGLEAAKILKSALEKGLLTEEQAQSLSEAEILKLIFRSGFSTKEKVTKISGRGMGMDIVQSIVDKYSGHIDVRTEVGLLTEFRLKFQIPQSILVETCLIFKAREILFAIPISMIQEVKKASEVMLNDVESIRTGQFQGLSVPVMTYDEQILQKRVYQTQDLGACTIVFLSYRQQTMGFVVEEVLYQIDLVVKPIERVCEKIPGVKGLGVLSNSELAYILDYESFWRRSS